MEDSWLIDGNCENCRRNNYCKKACTKAKRRRTNIIHNAVMQATGMDKILDAMGNREMFDDMAKANRLKH